MIGWDHLTREHVPNPAYSTYCLDDVDPGLRNSKLHKRIHADAVRLGVSIEQKRVRQAMREQAAAMRALEAKKVEVPPRSERGLLMGVFAWLGGDW